MGHADLDAAGLGRVCRRDHRIDQSAGSLSLPLADSFGMRHRRLGGVRCDGDRILWPERAGAAGRTVDQRGGRHDRRGPGGRTGMGILEMEEKVNGNRIPRGCP